MSIKSIFITGASSGLGRALSLHYAKEGVCLFLCGRDKEKLFNVAADCQEKGAEVHTFLFDVTNPADALQAIYEADSIHTIDLLIANAGISGGVLGIAETAEQTRRVFATNIGGVTNIVLPTLEKMRKRKHGQIAIVSSIAGYRGLPSCPAYSASKACVKTWCST